MQDETKIDTAVLIESIKTTRGEVKPWHEFVTKVNPRFMQGNEDMFKSVTAGEPLPPKVRELILFAATLCHGIASTHSQKARSHGATDAELMAVVELVTNVAAAKPLVAGVNELLKR